MDKKAIWILVGVLLALPGAAPAQTEWVDDDANPVIGPADPGAWDSNNRYPLAVIEVDGTYHLFFNGQADGSSFALDYDIGHATSADGVSWEIDPANPVLTRGADGEWDDTTLWGAAVIHDEAGFRMWYMGFDGELGHVGLATSADGTTWTKHANNPLMHPGAAGSFDDEMVIPRTVIVQDGLYRMWYHASQDTGAVISLDKSFGYAESEDGLSWTRHPEPILDVAEGWESSWISAPSVFFDGTKYHMWYTGARSGHVAIGYAVSADGLEWTRYWGNPVVGTTGAGSQVNYEHPSVLFDRNGGGFEMWYRDNGADSIRRATSSCCSMTFGLIIPAAAYAAGAEGSFYETDVDVSNAGSFAAEYRFVWLPRGVTEDQRVWSEAFTLGANMSQRYSNVAGEVFGLEPDSFGALVIESSSPDLLAMARIANVVDSKAAATYGQAMPALRPDELITETERRRIVFATEHEAMRSNVGCVNVSGTLLTLDFELIAADGTSLETRTMFLWPWGNDQINRVLGDYQPMTGVVDVRATAGGGSYYCYGSVLDNTTSDPTTIPAR